MSFSLRDITSDIPERAERPYLPYPLAVESGVIADPEYLARPLDDPAGVVLANGFLPNARQAGLVDTGKDIFAFDLTTIEIGKYSLQIHPASKDKVSNDGQIMEEGVVIAENKSGLLRIVALAIDRNRRPWLADKLSPPKTTHSLGRISVISANPLDIPDHEITDVDWSTSSITAKPRTKYF